ncbi:CE1759 family FMN reductase [Burkholderia sp. TSV86]|uniref:CE1759 family FMN reductase n=1 Tax=Burkholderia sp. TSV86 TaxID=1385594 RepID=UPI0009E9FB3C|nr:CE1759 family FMN reductase [Burkholderia sp. TSV86]
MKKIAIITAGVSFPSSTDFLASRIMDTVKEVSGEDDELEFEWVELRKLAAEISQAIVTGEKGAALQNAIDSTMDSDALIVATPVYQGSYSGLFKMFIDLLRPDGITAKPVLLAATGGSVRHSLMLDGAMRTLFGYLRAWVVPTAIFATSKDWAQKETEEILNERIKSASSELWTLTANQSQPALLQ